MSDAMALEHLLLKLCELDGYWGRTHVRVGHSPSRRELDVLTMGFFQGEPTVRVGEVKARGVAGLLPLLEERSSGGAEQKPQGGQEKLSEWQSFLEAVTYLYPGNFSTVKGLPPWNTLRNLEVYFVVNGWELPDPKDTQTIQKALQRELTERWGYVQEKPDTLRKLDVRILTTLDLMVGLIERVREARQGRGGRFGDPFLDGVREMLRYLDPDFSFASPDSSPDLVHKKGIHNTYRMEVAARICASLGIPVDTRLGR